MVVTQFHVCDQTTIKEKTVSDNESMCKHNHQATHTISLHVIERDAQ